MWQYRTGIRLNILAGWAILMVLSAAPGCRRDEPTAPETTSPAASKRPTPVATKPVDELQPTTSQPSGADLKDDPNSPRALPKSEELRDWIKTKPVEVVTSDNLKSLLSNRAQLAALSTYHIQSAARCSYGVKSLNANVLFIEASSPVDSFGIFSIMTPLGGTLNQINRSIRAVDTTANSRTMYAWQGNTYVQAQFMGHLDGKAEKLCDYLFNRITFNTPAADPPLLVQAIQPEQLAVTKIWVVRNLTALKGVKNEILQKFDAAQMNTRLGLTGEEILSIATVPVEEDKQNNLIWLVEYVDPKAATAGYRRYQSVLQSPSSDLDSDSIVYSPKGKVLFGSWTAGQESIQHLLDKLKTALPD